MKYEECVKHKMTQNDHIKSILTSKEFASEGKFVAVARAMGKVRYTAPGIEIYESPYKSKDRRGRPPLNISDEGTKKNHSAGYSSMSNI